MSEEKPRRSKKPLTPNLYFYDDSVEAIEAIAKITKTERLQKIMDDALRTYLWVLHRQTFNMKVVATSDNPANEEEMINLIKNMDEAKIYFDNLRW